MSIHAMSWAIKVKGLPIATKAVLMILAESHNGETGQCNPSIAYLQEITGLKDRALQIHMKALEAAGLLDREYVHYGRGKGCSVGQYTLKIGILGAVKSTPIEAKENAPAKECARKIRSMRPQNIAGPYKEEPEENRNNKPRKAENDRFDEAWALYRSCPLKANQTKKLAKAQWPKAVARAGAAEPILKAIETEVARRRSPDGFVAPLPDMHRWLSQERWQDVHGDQPPQPEPGEVSEGEWANAMRRWVDTGEWLADWLCPPPDQPGCKAPPGMLRHAARQLPEKSSAILANIQQDKAA